MKAVILAAGEGRRMLPLSLVDPKPLLKVNDRSILEHILDSFPVSITEVVIVVRYLGDNIKQKIGNKYRHMEVKYVQGSPKGNAYSFLATRRYLKNEAFLITYGDDIPGPNDVRDCINMAPAIVTYVPRNPQKCGMVYLRPDGTIKRIIEKPKTTTARLAASGLMVLNTDIFDYAPTERAGEFQFSMLVNDFVRHHEVNVIESSDFIGEISAPDDLVRAGQLLDSRQ